MHEEMTQSLKEKPKTPVHFTYEGRTQRPSNALLVILILVLMGLVAFVAYNRGVYDAHRSPVPEPLLVIASPAPSGATGSETVGWKTYANTDYNFGFKYPNTMFFQKNSDPNGNWYIGIGSLVENKFASQEVHYPFIGINVIKTDLSPQEWVNNYTTQYSFIGGGNAPKSIDTSKFYYSGVADVKPNQITTNIEAISFSSEGTSYGLDHNIWKLKPEYLIDIYRHTSGAGEIDTNTYNQILSTFQFTN